MGKAKKVVTFLTATSMLFGTSAISFAQETKTDAATTVLIATDAAEKLVYKSQSYVAGNGEIIGNYPVFTGMKELSNKIYSDVQTAVDSLNTNNFNNEEVVTYTVDESKDGFAKITVTVDKDNMTNVFNYYVSKKDKKEVTKDEFDKGVVDNKDGQTTGSSLEVTMVPLRSNAEKLGWKVNWEQKTATEPSKAILTKDSKSVKILVDANLDYDLIVNEDTSKAFITTVKLDKPAELQDSTLYVPSTFFDKVLGK